jgi:two-component system cell cycle sensor histidine kinase/response regulator CckA
LTGKGTVLLVDDESSSLRLFTDILEDEGYRVRAAGSGEIALASLTAEPPELILLDIGMQGVDGLEVCRRIKASEKSRRIPLIVISAATEADERVEGLSLGAVDFISKPFRREELLARIRTHMELGRLRSQLEMQVAERTAELRMANENLQIELAERGRVEQALRESESRFRNMADTAPVMIWVSGPDKLATFFNKGWLDFTGVSLERQLENGWTANVHPDEEARAQETYSSAFDNRRNYRMEHRLRRADGEYRWVLDNGVPRFEPDGAFVGYISSSFDITDLKNAQESTLARQKLESLGVLAEGIAHDFNNLLGSIHAQAELAELEQTQIAFPEKEIHSIKMVAQRGSEIVRQLMIYAGNEKSNFEPLDLSTIVEEMLELLKIAISKCAVLEADLEADLPAILGNGPEIRQVVMNLVLNASDAIGGKSGVITVRTSLVSTSRELALRPGTSLPKGDYIRLEVSDTGSGIPKEAQARVFDPFVTTKFKGRGLGLAVVQGVVRAHQGGIALHSILGKGTTFQIYLPCAAQPYRTPRRAAPQAVAKRSPVPRRTVLVVEGEDSLRISISRALRREGFSVIEAADGSSAVNLFRNHKNEIEAVLLDLITPGASSSSFVTEASAIRPGIKIIFMSAQGAKKALPSLQAEQIGGFLRKPFPLRDMVKLVRETLSSSAAPSAKPPQSRLNRAGGAGGSG